MEVGDFAPAILILVLIAIQLVSGYAIIPGRLSFRLVSHAKRPAFCRAVIRLWLGLAILYSIGVLVFKYISSG